MKKSYFFILALILNFHFIGAQFIKLDPHYTPVEDENPIHGPGDSRFVIAKTGHIYKRNFSGNIVKYLPNGNVDTSFGTNGSITPPQNMYYPIAVDDNGLYLISINGNSSNNIQLVAKYYLNGGLDTSFGINGVADLSSGLPSSNGFIGDILINNDQSLYVRNDSSVIKVLPTGIIDTVFGTKNFVNPIKILRTSNNFLLVYYKSTPNQGMITKYLPQGNLDISFGNAGELILQNAFNASTITSAYINGLNEIFVSLSTGLIKYTATGSLDMSFGNNGLFSLSSMVGNISSSNDVSISKVDFDNNNKIVLFGTRIYITDVQDFLGRVNVDGTKDNSFNENGTPSYYISPIVGVTFGIYNAKVISNDEFICLRKLRIAIIWREHKAIKYINSSSPLSVNENDNKLGDLYFNNPFNNELTFNLKEKIKNVELYDESGKLILSGNTATLNTSSLVKGIYFIKITTESNKIISKKGIKN